MLAISCVALVFGIIYAVTSPTVIVNMQVTLRQLFYNGIMMIFGGLLRSIVCFACVAATVALAMFYPFAVALTLYAVPLLTAKLMKENFYKLKAKALKVSVYELKRQEAADDYIDENGEISREDASEINDEKA